MFMNKPNQAKKPLTAIRTVSNPAWNGSPAPGTRDGTPSIPPTPASAAAGQQGSFDLSAKSSWKAVTKLIGDLISAQQELAKVHTELNNITALQAHTEGLPNYTAEALLLRASALQSKKITFSSQVDNLSEAIAEKFMLASNGFVPTELEEILARIGKLEQSGPAPSKTSSGASSTNEPGVDSLGQPIDTPSLPPAAGPSSATSSAPPSSGEMQALKYEMAKQSAEMEKLRAQLCSRMEKLEKRVPEVDAASSSGRTPMRESQQPRQASIGIKRAAPPPPLPPVQHDNWGDVDLSRNEPPEMQPSDTWDDEPPQSGNTTQYAGNTTQYAGNATQYAGSSTEYGGATPQIGNVTPGPPEMMHKSMGAMTPGPDSHKPGSGVVDKTYLNRKLKEIAAYVEHAEKKQLHEIRSKEKILTDMVKNDRRKAKTEINGIGQSLNSLQHKLGYNVLNTKANTLRSAASNKNLAASVSAASATTPIDETPALETPAVPETPLEGSVGGVPAGTPATEAVPTINGTDKAKHPEKTGEDTTMAEGEETQQIQTHIDQPETQTQTVDSQIETQATEPQEEPASKKRKRASSVGMSVASDSTSSSVGPAKAGTLVHTVERLVESVDELKRGHLESEQSAVDLLNTVTATRTLIRELDGRIEVLEDDFDKAKLKGSAHSNGVAVKEVSHGMDVDPAATSDSTNSLAPPRRGISAVMLDDMRETLETQLRQVRSNLESAINDLEKDKTLQRRVDAVEKQVSHLETDLANQVAWQAAKADSQASKAERRDKAFKQIEEKVETLNKQLPKDSAASKKSQDALQEKVAIVDAQVQGITERFASGDDRLCKLEQKWDEISPNLNIVTRFMASQVESDQY